MIAEIFGQVSCHGSLPTGWKKGCHDALGFAATACRARPAATTPDIPPEPMCGFCIFNRANVPLLADGAAATEPQEVDPRRCGLAACRPHPGQVGW